MVPFRANRGCTYTNAPPTIDLGGRRDSFWRGFSSGHQSRWCHLRSGLHRGTLYRFGGLGGGRCDTDDTAIGAEDNDCADASLGQQFYCRARSAVGSIVTTLPRLPSKMFLTIMAASLVRRTIPRDAGPVKRMTVRRKKDPRRSAFDRAPCCSRSHKSSEEPGGPGRISERCLRHFSSVRHSALGRYSSNSGPCCRRRWLSSLTPWREAFGAGASCITKT